MAQSYAYEQYVAHKRAREARENPTAEMPTVELPVVSERRETRELLHGHPFSTITPKARLTAAAWCSAVVVCILGIFVLWPGLIVLGFLQPDELNPFQRSIKPDEMSLTEAREVRKKHDYLALKIGFTATFVILWALYAYSAGTPVI